MKIITNALAIAAIAMALRHSSASSSSKASKSKSKATQHSSYLVFDQGGKSGKSVSNTSSSKITANIKSKSSKSQPYFIDDGIIRAEIEQEVEEGDEIDEEPVSDSTFVSIPPSPSVSLVSSPNDIDVVVGVNVTDVTLDINTYSNKSEAASKSSKSSGGTSSSRGMSYSINEIELVDKIEEFISILDSKSTLLISSASSDDVDKTEDFNEDIEDDSQLQSQMSQSYSTPTILLPLSRTSIVVSNQQAASIGGIKSSGYRYGKGCKMTKAAKMFKDGNNSASTISVVSLKSKASKFFKEVNRSPFSHKSKASKMFKDNSPSSPIIVQKSKAPKMFKEIESSVDASSTPQLPTPSIVISKATKATKLFKKEEEEDSFFISKSKAGKFFKSSSISTSPSSTGCRQ